MGRSTDAAPVPRVVGTAWGPVEVVVVPGEREPVLFLPGGHCPASVDCGWDAYRRLGHGIVSFSRPGYGRTAVGPLTAAEFTPVVADVLHRLGIEHVAAGVGVSFGGLQAVRLAAALPGLVPRLVLHSCAPSGLPFPDTAAERFGGSVAFGPGTERATWAATRRLVRSDRGLRLMLGQLSTRPVETWWHTWSDTDRDRARAAFGSMRSGSGFVTDLRQATPALSAARREAQRAVSCPTLVTASRSDGGVAFAHAEDLAATVPGARLVETDAPTHLFWIGPGAEEVAGAVATFLADPA